MHVHMSVDVYIYSTQTLHILYTDSTHSKHRYVHTHVCILICIHTFMHTYNYTYIYIYVAIHVHTHLYNIHVKKIKNIYI